MSSAISFLCCISFQIYESGSFHESYSHFLVVMYVTQEYPCQIVFSEVSLEFDFVRGVVI